MFCIHIIQYAWWRLFFGGVKGGGFQANLHTASQQQQCITVQPEPEVVTYLNQRPSLQTFRDFLWWPVWFKLGHNSKAANHFKIKAKLILHLSNTNPVALCALQWKSSIHILIQAMSTIRNAHTHACMYTLSGKIGRWAKRTGHDHRKTPDKPETEFQQLCCEKHHQLLKAERAAQHRKQHCIKSLESKLHVPIKSNPQSLETWTSKFWHRRKQLCSMNEGLCLCSVLCESHRKN